MGVFRRVRNYVEFGVNSAFHMNQLQPVPKPIGTGVMELAKFIGEEAADIERRGQIQFHAVGDAGSGDDWQERIARAMASEIQVEDPSQGPIFCLNLGDIAYGPDKSPRYANQFYRPNRYYLTRQRQDGSTFNGIILAIPGNHDGEARSVDDMPTLKAFLENFCVQDPDDPPMAASFGVTMPGQPGPYWHLRAPYLDLIGLYSNAAEEFGSLIGPDEEPVQLNWLTDRLKAIAADRAAGRRKSLVFATHHPPYGRGFQPEFLFDHGSSPELQKQLDLACATAGVWPDAVLSGHSHNFQLYTRDCVDSTGRRFTIPYIVSGTGGKGGEKVHPHRERLVETHDRSGPALNESVANYLGGLANHGYLRITADHDSLEIYFIIIGENGNGPTITVNLTNGTLQVKGLMGM